MNVRHEIVDEGRAKDLFNLCLLCPWLDPSPHWSAVAVYWTLWIYRSKALPSLQNQICVNRIPLFIVAVILLPLKLFQQIEIIRNFKAWIT